MEKAGLAALRGRIHFRSDRFLLAGVFIFRMRHQPFRW